MTEPTCRTCYVGTLSKDERDHFLAEPVTMPIHYCQEHQVMINNMLDSFDWDHVVIHGARTGRFTSTTPSFEEIEND